MALLLKQQKQTAMNKILLILVTAIAILLTFSSLKISPYTTLAFLPITAYFISNLFTNSKDFNFKKNKKETFFYFGIVLIIALFSVFKFI